jgi:hypothetical protein
MPSQTATAHIDEIAEILAAGLMRLQARKSSQISPPVAENSLHISAPRAVIQLVANGERGRPTQPDSLVGALPLRPESRPEAGPAVVLVMRS